MKILKYTILVIGILGLTASIFNTIYNESISNQTTGFFSGILLIFISLNLDRLINGFKTLKSPEF